MAVEQTRNQLNSLDKSALIEIRLTLQSQLNAIDQKLQLLLEPVAVINNHRFGRSSEKLGIDE